MNPKMVELIDLLCRVATSEMFEEDTQKAYEMATACGLKTREEFGKVVHSTNEEEDLSPWDDPSLEPENYARDRMVWDHYADDWVIEPPFDEQER